MDKKQIRNFKGNNNAAEDVKTFSQPEHNVYFQ